jgi:hypothetical protein
VRHKEFYFGVGLLHASNADIGHLLYTSESIFRNKKNWSLVAAKKKKNVRTYIRAVRYLQMFQPHLIHPAKIMGSRRALRAPIRFGAEHADLVFLQRQLNVARDFQLAFHFVFSAQKASLL